MTEIQGAAGGGDDAAGGNDRNGSSLGPHVPLPVELPAGLSESGSEPRAERWWQALEDPQLSQLIDEALVGNLDLDTVWDRLVQARAVARRDGAAPFPTVGLDGTVGTTWSKQVGRASSADFGGTGLRRADLSVRAADRSLHVDWADRLPRLALASSPQLTSEVLADLVDDWGPGWRPTSRRRSSTPAGDAPRSIGFVPSCPSGSTVVVGQVVLISLREGEDALVQESQQRRLIESLESQLELGLGTLARLRDRYIKGSTDYLDVLAADARGMG